MFTYKEIHKNGKTQSSLLNDMINHTRGWEQMMVRGSMSSSCHECSHAASAEIRNKEKVKSNGFYLFNDLAYVCPEPKIRKSDAASFIHSQLRGPRYKTYITGQTAWDDQPLYIMDEWNAYIAGAECAVEIGKKGIMENKGTDISSGPIEFLIYSCGLLLAIQKKNPQFFEEQADFMEFFNYQYKRSITAAESASALFPWDSTTKLIEQWNGPICQEYRALLNTDTKITPPDVEGI